VNAVNFTYAVFGLLLRSDIQLPGLIPLRIDSIPSLSSLPSSSGASIALHMNVSPYACGAIPSGLEESIYTSSYKDDRGNPGLQIWKVSDGLFFHLVYFDRTEFWLDQQGTEIWATWPGHLTIENTATYLLGPVLGLLLRFRGVTCLHASAVAFEDRAVAFVGNEGAGKSTTAAALARKGCAVLSDDVVALSEHEGSFFVHPAYPYLCLWPESVESLYGSADALPPLSVNDDKRRLLLEKQELKFEERSLPLAAIYILAERRGDSAPVVEDMPVQKAFMTLVANTFATNVLDASLRAKEFEVLGRLVPRVPVRQLHAHSDAARIEDFCRLICEDVGGENLKVRALR
jgi:hypothetical protein